jgi:hypothetical protein
MKHKSLPNAVSSRGALGLSAAARLAWRLSVNGLYQYLFCWQSPQLEGRAGACHAPPQRMRVGQG